MLARSSIRFPFTQQAPPDSCLLGEHRHAIGCPHALACGQNEYRVDLCLDKPLAQLGRHLGKGDNGRDQRINVRPGTAAETIQERPCPELPHELQCLVAPDLQSIRWGFVFCKTRIACCVALSVQSLGGIRRRCRLCQKTFAADPPAMPDGREKPGRPVFMIKHPRYRELRGSEGCRNQTTQRCLTSSCTAATRLRHPVLPPRSAKDTWARSRLPWGLRTRRDVRHGHRQSAAGAR